MPDFFKKLRSPKYTSVFESIKLIPAQFESAFLGNIIFPENYKSVKNIVFCGMGGSALAAHIFQALNISLVPFYFYNGYEIPAYIDSNTLFIASSYSGNTEEVLSSVKEAKKRGAKIIGLSAGGALCDFLQKNKYPAIKFDGKFNPSAQPRYGLGYGLGALLNIFVKLELINLKIATIQNLVKLKQPSLAEAANLAKKLKGFAPIVVASEFLEGNAHILVNQFNESCKNFSEWHGLPEMNHHLMEGMKRPAIGKYLKFLFIESDLYKKEISARIKITKAVVEKNKIGYTDYRVKGKTKLEQVLNFLIFGGLVSLILAIDYNEDPESIPFVDYFKDTLKKMS